MKKPDELKLRALIDNALVETLPAVGYERIRGRRELQNAIVAAVKKWLKEPSRRQE